jgi:hypothetical protein
VSLSKPTNQLFLQKKRRTCAFESKHLSPYCSLLYRVAQKNVTGRFFFTFVSPFKNRLVASKTSFFISDRMVLSKLYILFLTINDRRKYDILQTKFKLTPIIFNQGHHALVDLIDRTSTIIYALLIIPRLQNAAGQCF